MARGGPCVFQLALEVALCSVDVECAVGELVHNLIDSISDRLRKSDWNSSSEAQLVHGELELCVCVAVEPD